MALQASHVDKAIPLYDPNADPSSNDVVAFPVNVRSPLEYPRMEQFWLELPNELWLRIIDVSPVATVQKIACIKPELFQVVTDYHEDPRVADRTHHIYQAELNISSFPFFRSVFVYDKLHKPLRRAVLPIDSKFEDTDPAKVLLFEIYDTDNVQTVWKNFPERAIRRVAMSDTLDKIYKFHEKLRNLMLRIPFSLVFPSCLNCIVTSQIFVDLEPEERRLAYLGFLPQAQAEVLPAVKRFVFEIFDNLDFAFEGIYLPTLKYLRFSKTQVARFKDLWLPEIEDADLSMTFNPGEDDLNYHVFHVENIYVPKLRTLRLHRASTIDNYAFIQNAYWIPNLEEFFISSLDFYKDGTIDVFNDLDRVLSMGVHERFFDDLIPFLKIDKPKLKKLTLYDVKTCSNGYHVWKHFANWSIDDLTLGVCTKYNSKFYDNPNVQFPLSSTLTKLTISQMDTINRSILHHLSCENNVQELEYTIRVDNRKDEHISFESHLIEIANKFPHLKKLTLNYYETPLIVRRVTADSLIPLTFPHLEELMVYSTHSVNVNVFIKGSHFFSFPMLKKFFLMACGDYKNVLKHVLETRNSNVDEDYETLMADDFEDDAQEDYGHDRSRARTGSSSTPSEPNSNAILQDQAQNTDAASGISIKESDIKLESISAMNHFLTNEGVSKSNSLINYEVAPHKPMRLSDAGTNGTIYPSYDFQFEAPLLEKLSVFSLYFSTFDTISVAKYPRLQSLDLLRCFDGFNRIDIGTLELDKQNKDVTKVNEFNRLSTRIERIVYNP